MSKSIHIEKYLPSREKEWDAFVASARNGHFMFLRRYMEYHAERFQDMSLLFYQQNKLVAVLPAHKDGNTLASHKGLTFGGFLTDARMTYSLMQNVFGALMGYLKTEGFSEVLYKAIPACYHQLPACEDLAVLTQAGAALAARDLMSVVDLRLPRKYTKGVRWSIQKGKKLGLQVRRTYAFAEFMAIMADVLESRHKVTPAHTAEELEKLAALFPENILLYGLYQEDELLGGTVIYLSAQVAHAQYIGMGIKGRELSATPFLLDAVFEVYRGQKPYFSFGTSPGGVYINEGLYAFKESLGARAMLQEQYLLPLA